MNANSNGVVIGSVTGSGLNYKSLQSQELFPGIWLILSNVTFINFTGYAGTSIGTTLDSYDQFCNNYVPYTGTAGTGAAVLPLTRVVAVTTKTTYYLSAQTGTGTSASNILLYAVRIG